MTKSEFLNRLYEMRSKCQNESILEHINKMIEHIEHMMRNNQYD
jgi:nucleoid DNA-binding protein